MADDSANDRYIWIPDEIIDIIGFKNTFKLRNELYKLKEELCRYLCATFAEFWEEIYHDLRMRFWADNSIQSSPVVSQFIIDRIEQRQTNYIKRSCWQGTEEHKRRLAENWITSNISKLAECFIPSYNLTDQNGYNFSFENCDPAQLLNVYQNYNPLDVVCRKEAGDVRKVRNRYIAHLRRLDEVSSPLYDSNSATIESFRQYLH